MNNKQIERLVFNHPHGKNFEGVFAIDTLPINPIHGKSYIVNLDESYKPGSHWIAIYFPQNYMYPAEYFDSAGLKPLQLEFYEFMNQNPYFLYNNLVLQDDFSTLCGEYCIHYICERMSGKNASKILSDFRVRDQQFNDRYFQNYMFQQFKIRVPIIDTDFVTSQLFSAY